MALTKEQLVKLGVPESACTAVIEASSADTKASIDGHYVPKEKLDANLEKLKALQGQVTERDAQITKLGNLQGDAAKFKEESEKLTKLNAEQQEKFKKEMQDKDKRLSLKLLLMKDNCVDPDEAAGKFDLDSLTVDDDGKIVAGYENQRDSLKTSKPYFFGSGEDAKAGDGGNKPTPPGFAIQGTTPPDPSDPEDLSGPEAKAAAMAKSMLEKKGVGQPLYERAASKFFGGKGKPTAPTETK